MVMMAFLMILTFDVLLVGLFHVIEGNATDGIVFLHVVLHSSLYV